MCPVFLKQDVFLIIKLLVCLQGQDLLGIKILNCWNLRPLTPYLARKSLSTYILDVKIIMSENNPLIYAFMKHFS